jgi:hypothetical protein
MTLQFALKLASDSLLFRCQEGKFPCILGHEAAGIVESVGAGVTTVHPLFSNLQLQSSISFSSLPSIFSAPVPSPRVFMLTRKWLNITMYA